MNQNFWFKGKFGLEREAVRIDRNGVISKKGHPFNEHNPFITKDFAEAQIEMITPPMSSIQDAVNILEDIQNIVLINLDDDLLWKQSNPPIISETGIEVAHFKENPKKEKYREYLSKKYGEEKSIISGVHFNVSFDETILRYLYNQEGATYKSYEEFKSAAYLKVAKYLLRDRWFLIYLTNASPVFHNSYYQHCVRQSQQLESGDCMMEGLQSLRNSVCGYRNKHDYLLNYESWQAYQDSVDRVIDEENLAGSSELYTPVRLKTDEHGDVDYLEIRFLDIYPFSESGVNTLDLKYLHLFMIHALQQKDFNFDDQMQKIANENHNMASRNDSCICEMLEAMNQLHHNVKSWTYGEHKDYDFNEIFNAVEEKIQSETKTYAYQLRKEYEKSSYVEYHLREARKDYEYAHDCRFDFKLDSSLELSTKILVKEAILRGYEFEIIDSQSNFIRITDPRTDHSELISQATKTNLDFYANVLAMENKSVTKKILNQAKISTPCGYAVKAADEIDALDTKKFEKNGVVIKPNSTNFGEGITIYPHNASKANIKEAINYALEYDDLVLLESFQKGKEYRFLVIDQKVVGVLHRRAANVVGDGVSTIQTLVELKNKNPLRAKGYITPLEYLSLGRLELEFLALQNLDAQSIVKKGERVTLRENSNISTGGDSIDYTDEMDVSYIEIAEKSAQALGVNISGVDMMIENIKEAAQPDNYSILELNFNPAIHIHTYPLEGKDRKPALKILEALFEKEGKL